MREEFCIEKILACRKRKKRCVEERRESRGDERVTVEESRCFEEKGEVIRRRRKRKETIFFFFINEWLSESGEEEEKKNLFDEERSGWSGVFLSALLEESGCDRFAGRYDGVLSLIAEDKQFIKRIISSTGSEEVECVSAYKIDQNCAERC